MQLESPNSELQEVLDLIEQTPMGAEELGLVRTALSIAEDNELAGWSYVLRLWLNRSSFRMGDTNALLTSFTKTLTIHDSDPERFPLEVDEHTNLLFQYKWVAEMLNDSPVYSLEQINHIYTDMERRFREAGKSPSGYLQTRFGGACERGEWAEAARLYAELQVAPRDELSHCEACSRSTAAMYFAERGELDRALGLLQEIFSGKYLCGDEPEYSESQAALMYLRTGELEEAKRLHLKSLAAVSQNPEPSGIVLRHVLFCLLTGNTERALDLIEKNAKLFECSRLNVARQFESLTLLGILADALQKAGRGNIPVRGTGTHYYSVVLSGIGGGESHKDLTANDLAEFVWPRAEHIAKSFDERNRNDHYAKRLQSRRALLNLRYQLSVGIEEFEPEASYGITAPQITLETASDYVAEISNALPKDLMRAVRLYRQARETLAGNEQERELSDALISFLDVDLTGTAFNYESVAIEFDGFQMPQMGNLVREMRSNLATELSSEELAVAHSLFSTAMMQGETASAGYLALIIAERIIQSSPETSGVHLTHALENLVTIPMAQRIAVLSANIALRDGHIEIAQETLDQAQDLSYGARREDLEIAELEATIAVWAGDFDRAELIYKRAIDTAVAAQDFARAWPLSQSLAHAFTAHENPVEAVRALKRALRFAQTAYASEVEVQRINYLLGSQLVNAGHAHDALGPLTEVVNWNMTNNSAPEAVLSGFTALGEAAARAGEQQQAFSAWYFGLNYSAENGFPQHEFTFALRLTDFLVESEHFEALEFAVRAYKIAQQSKDPQLMVKAAKRVATTNAVFGKTADFDMLDKAIDALAESVENDDPELDISKIEAQLHKARLLWRLGKGTESGETALKAVEIAAKIELNEAQFDALVLAGVAFKSTGENIKARRAFERAQTFSMPGESPYEFAAQQMEGL